MQKQDFLLDENNQWYKEEKETPAMDIQKLKKDIVYTYKLNRISFE